MHALVLAQPECVSILVIWMRFSSLAALLLHVHAGPMVRSLKREKLVNGRDCLRILCLDHDLTTAWKVAGGVGDVAAQSAHLLCAGNVLHCVNETWQREIAGSKRFGDRLHVLADHSLTKRVGFLTL